jgi:DMSO/TMAO reductase YedYZ molybdopterin-dependent catalytic subunit
VHALKPSVPGLVTVVDQGIVRLAPGSFSRSAIEQVGAADKPALVLVTVALVIAIGTRVGVVAARRPGVGPVAFALFAALPVACAAWLPGVSARWMLLGAASAAGVGAATLWMLLTAAAVDSRPPPLPGAAVSRRRFLQVALVAAGGSAGAVAVAARLDRRAPPTGALPAASDVSGTAIVDELEVDGVSALITPNASFFRIDEALVAPYVDLSSWRLRVTGMVDTPIELSYDSLLAEPLIELPITLACVSNEVGGSLVGTARWRGVPLARLLERAGVQDGATQLVGRSVDGFTVGFPTSVARDGRAAMVAVGMNGAPLPRDHGFPARLVVPGLYGFVSATKWLQEIELTTWEAFDAYWIERGWAKEAPIKVQSRIDVPRNHSPVEVGPLTAAGVAWAPTEGIAAVDVRIDKGAWQPCRLGPSLGGDAWRQWSVECNATPGEHVLEVRATTRAGTVQLEEKHEPFPDGATGLHRVHIRVPA